MNYEIFLKKNVRSVWLSPDAEKISFHMNDDTYLTLHTEADCCSETWVADIIGFDALKGKILKVTEIKEGQLDEPDGRSR